LKKNGFIATSLIYTFFLIFITLFLTIIGDYLQNKILLDTTEESIKANLHTKLNVSSLNVGDIIQFVSDCDNLSSEMNNIEKIYIVANVKNKEVVLYQYQLSEIEGLELTCQLTDSYIENDLVLNGNSNTTTLNKVLYTYESTEMYLIGEYKILKRLATGESCLKDNKYNTDIGCYHEPISANKYRKRFTSTELDGKDKCHLSDDISGTLYIKWDPSIDECVLK